MIRKALALVLALIVSVGLIGTTATTSAQPQLTVVASGLNAPRGLAFGPDGKLYVAEAGVGGDEEVNWVPPFLKGRIGTSSRILRIDGNQKTVFAEGIQSIALGDGAEVVGAQDIAFASGALYALVGQANALPIPGGRETKSLLIKIGQDGKFEQVADLGKFEKDNNPDGTVPDSNPFGLSVAPSGELYVTDAGANDLLKVTTGGQISVVHAWRDNPVPTSVAFDQAGNAHAVFLTGAPFPAGASRLERITASGTQVVVPGLTMAVDLKRGPDGSLYILEFAAGFQLSPPPPHYIENSGRVLKVVGNTAQVMASGLQFPSKMAFGPDGALYVTNKTVGSGAGNGEVIKLTLPASGPPITPAPVAQPSPAAKPAAAASPSPAPAQAPRPAASPAALPRTGVGPDAASSIVPAASAGAALMLTGLGMLWRRRRR